MSGHQPPPPYYSNQPAVITHQPGKKEDQISHFSYFFTHLLIAVPTQHTVILQTVPVLGPAPSYMNCPNCNASIMTEVDYEISGRTHLCALGMCVFQFWLCIPFLYLCDCGGCCKRTIHRCPRCNTKLGSF